VGRFSHPHLLTNAFFTTIAVFENLEQMKRSLLVNFHRRDPVGVAVSA